MSSNIISNSNSLHSAQTLRIVNTNILNIMYGYIKRGYIKLRIDDFEIRVLCIRKFILIITVYITGI